jgi:hypothetical protein
VWGGAIRRAMKGKAKLESQLKLYKIMAVPTMRHKGKVVLGL